MTSISLLRRTREKKGGLGKGRAAVVERTGNCRACPRRKQKRSPPGCRCGKGSSRPERRRKKKTTFNARLAGKKRKKARFLSFRTRRERSSEDLGGDEGGETPTSRRAEGEGEK